MQTPDVGFSKALDVTPPTPALDIDDSPTVPIAYPIQALPLTGNEDDLTILPPSPIAVTIVMADVPVPEPLPRLHDVTVCFSSIPHFFHPLVQALEESRMSGTSQPLRSWVGLRIPRGTYAQANVATFKQYTAAAEKAGLVELGGLQAKAWISLRPEWHGKIPVQLVS